MELDFDVVDLPDPDPPAVGEQAPDFERPLANEEYWEDTALSDLTADGPVLLCFHTMDGAFPTTYLWNEISEREWGHRGHDDDLTVVGCSISSPYEHKTTIEERRIDDLDYRLFSDPQNGVAEAYGIANDLDGMAGISEPKPAVFVVDEERTVRWAWVAETWPAFPPYDEVEAAVDDL